MGANLSTSKSSTGPSTSSIQRAAEDEIEPEFKQPEKHKPFRPSPERPITSERAGEIKSPSGKYKININTEHGAFKSVGGGTRRRKKRRWSKKYKKSINCRRPKGFSQKQYCKYGRKKQTRRRNKKNKNKNKKK